MTTKFLSAGLWPRIRSLAGKAGPRLAAVPFVGAGAVDQLPLRAGDTLVTRIDELTVRAGLTHPAEILRYLNRGVEVHAVGNLHAKVYVLGDIAVIGSSNVSTSSATRLIEAAALITDARVVSACRDFIRQLRGDVVEREYVRRLLKVYRPPKLPNTKPTGPSRRMAGRIIQSPMLAVPLVEETWDEVDNREGAKARAVARRRQEDRRAFALEEFLWEGATGIKRFRVGQRILQCTEVGKQVMVSPPARVLAIRKYRIGRTTRAVICVEVRRDLRRKSLSTLLDRLGARGKPLKGLDDCKALRDRELVYAIGQVWPNSG